MFTATQNKGFQIKFENGNTISVQWGPANYCSPTHDEGRGAAYDAPAQTGTWSSETAEVAAWNSNCDWHNFGGDTVNGWLTPKEVIEFMTFVANNELEITPDYYADSDNDEEPSEEPEPILT
jgi:hypothetical protein